MATGTLTPSGAIDPRPLQHIDGRVVLPTDPDWDDARQAFDLALDLRPAAVVFPHDAHDVMEVVGHARSHGLRIAPQATGHNAGPFQDLSDTILVNVRELGEVSIDAAACRVRVGAGVKWEKVVPRLSAHGLAALHGSSPDVGIAGYSLGGGMGWLARKHGLQCNSVTAIEIVTADGGLVRTTAETEPDLFWALRGGGGNFGVVTAIEFAVYPVESLYAGQMFFPFERAAEVLHTWNAMLPSLPDEMMTWAALLHFPDVPFVPEPFRGHSFTVVYGAFLGGEDEGGALLRPVRALGPPMDTFAMAAPQVLSDLAMDPPDPLPLGAGSVHGLFEHLPPEGLDEILAVAGPGSASGTAITMLQLRHLGGALGRITPDAGARATIPGEVCMFAAAVTPDEVSLAAAAHAQAWLRTVIEPHHSGAYPNFVEHPADASAFFHDETWRRLRQVKASRDPGDLFRGNHHIPPAEPVSPAGVQELATAPMVPVTPSTLLHRVVDTGPAYWGPGDHYTFLVTGEESGGAYFAMEALVPPGGGPPPHMHRREDETFYVLAGEVRFLLGEEHVIAGPGDFVNVPRGTVHCFTNIGAETARMVLTFTPAGIERFFEETLEAAPNGAQDAPDNLDDVGARYREAAPRYGLEFV